MEVVEAIVLVEELLLVIIELCKKSGINGDRGGDNAEGKVIQTTGLDESTSWCLLDATVGTADLLDASISGLVLFVGLLDELFELGFMIMYLYL